MLAARYALSTKAANQSSSPVTTPTTTSPEEIKCAAAARSSASTWSSISMGIDSRTSLCTAPVAGPGSSRARRSSAWLAHKSSIAKTCAAGCHPMSSSSSFTTSSMRELFCAHGIFCRRTSVPQNDERRQRPRLFYPRV